MVIDSHLHVLKAENFDKVTAAQIGHRHPEDTPIEDLVGWLVDAGVHKAIVMGQDTTRMWNSSCGEDYVLECVNRYPDLFVPLAAVEAVDRSGRFNHAGLEYVERAVLDNDFKGMLLTPPYGYYSSDDPQVYPFYEKALELDVVVQYHHCATSAGVALAPYRYCRPESLHNVLIDFPGMKVVLEHLNYPWYEELFFLMANPGVCVYADLAMTYHRPLTLTWNLVKAKEFGVLDKIMYASDYWTAGAGVFSDNPGDDMQRWIELIRHGINEVAGRSGWPTFTENEIEGILCRNAARLYGLEPEV